MKADWKQILEWVFKIAVPFTPKGWRTVILNAVVFLLGLSELLMNESGGLLTLLCEHFNLACGDSIPEILVTVAGILNVLLRTITDTPVTSPEPKTDQ